MPSRPDLTAAIGTIARGRAGEELGTVEAVFADNRTGDPTWVAVSGGDRRSIVPAADATLADGTLALPVSGEAVRSAPQVGDEDRLAPQEEALLREHYRRFAQPADGGMIRREQQLRVVGTERVPTTRLRLVKYVVTEEVQVSVPVRREEIRVEEVPLEAPEPAAGESLVASYATAPAGGLPDEIVLHAERPVVSVEVVPVERVRLRTDVVTDQQTLTDRVEREQIAVQQERILHQTGPDGTVRGQ